MLRKFEAFNVEPKPKDIKDVKKDASFIYLLRNKCSILCIDPSFIYFLKGCCCFLSFSFVVCVNFCEIFDRISYLGLSYIFVLFVSCGKSKTHFCHSNFSLNMVPFLSSILCLYECMCFFFLRNWDTNIYLGIVPQIPKGQC